MSPRQIAGQALFWLPVMLLVALLAHWPTVSPVPPGHGELKLSLAHLSERMQPCRPLSEAERAAMPANMRAFEHCERARAVVALVIELDDKALLQEQIRPAGLHRDGRAYLFKTWPLPAGNYRLRVKLRDSPRDQGFDHSKEFELKMLPQSSALLAISDEGAFLQGAELSSAPPP